MPDSSLSRRIECLMGCNCLLVAAVGIEHRGLKCVTSLGGGGECLERGKR